MEERAGKGDADTMEVGLGEARTGRRGRQTDKTGRHGKNLREPLGALGGGGSQAASHETWREGEGR